jgi:hypothetical protein
MPLSLYWVEILQFSVTIELLEVSEHARINSVLIIPSIGSTQEKVQIKKHVSDPDRVKCSYVHVERTRNYCRSICEMFCESYIDESISVCKGMHISRLFSKSHVFF